MRTTRGLRSIVEALDLAAPPALVSIVGGGGKSSLMFALGRELPGRVVMTTTTRIFAAQRSLAVVSRSIADPHWERALEALPPSLLLVGGLQGERALGVPPELAGALLERPEVDFVVVEADGSRMLPVKAPASHEPVIPRATGLLVAVAGIDALAGPICEVAHRPERVSAITGLAPDQALTPEALAALLADARGGRKDAPRGARFALLINKVESPEQRALAERVAAAALSHAQVERVVVGALRARSNWDLYTG